MLILKNDPDDFGSIEEALDRVAKRNIQVTKYHKHNLGVVLSRDGILSIQNVVYIIADCLPTGKEYHNGNAVYRKANFSSRGHAIAPISLPFTQQEKDVMFSRWDALRYQNYDTLNNERLPQ